MSVRSLETVKLTRGARCHSRSHHISRCLSAPSSAAAAESDSVVAPNNRVATRKSADKDFILDVLSANASKRDARSYLANFKPVLKPYSRNQQGESVSEKAVNVVNLGGLFPSEFFSETRAGISTSQGQTSILEDGDVTLRTAIVLLKLDQDVLDGKVLKALGRTLSQLSKLGLSPVVVLQPSRGIDSGRTLKIGETARTQAEQVISAIEKNEGHRARLIESAFEPAKDHHSISSIRLVGQNVLLQPLSQGIIPVIVPLSFHPESGYLKEVDGFAAVRALAQEFAHGGPKPRVTHGLQDRVPGHLSLDRIIIVDSFGGIPWNGQNSGYHVFVNLEQEHDDIQAALRESKLPKEERNSHSQNLQLARDCLAILPPASSAIITNPLAMSFSRQGKPGNAGYKNPLIHNLLTDKPLFSSSLPHSRVASNDSISVSPPTLLKRGMPVSIFPRPAPTGWTTPLPSSQPFQLSSTDIDIPRLVDLIEDSFQRPLDVSAYFARIQPILAGVIIVGAYEGCAILTWEPPPDQAGADSNTTHAAVKSHPVPYLDKLAVRRASQGAGGVADLLFNAMVRDCFPEGVVWRSRTSNPVNGWYFERARGIWRLPGLIGGQNFTMFWTTPQVSSTLFGEYAAVCGGLGSFWKDGKSDI